MLFEMTTPENRNIPKIPFFDGFFEEPGFIEGLQLNRINRLAGSFKIGAYQRDNGNRAIVSVGLVGKRLMRKIDIWEDRPGSLAFHTVIDISESQGPKPVDFSARQEVFNPEEELDFTLTYSDAPGSKNTLRLGHVLQSLRFAKKLDEAEQPWEQEYSADGLI